MTPEDAKELIENSDNQSKTYLGWRTSSLGEEENVGIDDEDRTMHCLVSGPTGTGKTNLLLTIVNQDARKTGCCFLNPKGGVVDELIAKLPEERMDDVIYINPNRERCPAINLLNPEIPSIMTEAERNNQQKIVVSSVMGLFRRLTDDWGERWPRNLRSLITAHVALNVHRGEQNTLMDVYRCVTEDSELEELIERTPDRVTRKQLEEVTELSERERRPLLRRLSDLVENETVRKVIAQPEGDVSFREALAEKKIILVDAQAGHIGDWAASIIGSVVLTRLWSASVARSVLPPDQRPLFHILVDEIQEYVSEADHIRRMLSQCREFNVSITAATQYLDDLDTTMERALMNNTLTKAVFSPGASSDLNTYTTVMNGLSKDELSQLGKYRPAIQRPAEQSMPPAEVVDTYPPWDWDPELVEQRKTQLLEQYDVLEDPASEIPVDLGKGRNAGGERHRELLEQAEKRLQERGLEVDLGYQGAGDDKPDGKVELPDGSITHLEAENSTLSKPVKVLKNLHRAALQDREVLFVVEEGNADKLENIISDPVNRQGSDHEDEHGSYSYYTEDGESFTAIDELEDGEYRIIEVSENGLTIHDQEVESECPELNPPETTENELTTACMFREDGYCTALETECVLLQE